MTGVIPLPPGRIEAAGDAKGERSRGSRLEAPGFGDILKNDKSAKKQDAEEPAPPSRKRRAENETTDAAIAALIGAARAPEQAPALPWAQTDGSRAQGCSQADHSGAAGRGSQSQPQEGARKNKAVPGTDGGHPDRPVPASPEKRAANRPFVHTPDRPAEASPPARASVPALPPELVVLLAGGEAKAVSGEGNEPSAPEAEPAAKGSSWSRLNAAMASLDFGGFDDTRPAAAGERHARGRAAEPAAARERQVAAPLNSQTSEAAPKSIAEPRDAAAPRAPAGPSLPPGLAAFPLAVTAAPGAVAEALAAHLPEAARPTGLLPAQFARPGDGVRILMLELKPDTLGSVTARLKLEDDKLAVEITVTTAEARDRLGSDGGEIAEALEALGLSVDRVTVSLGETRGSGESGESRFAPSGDRTGRGEGGSRGGESQANAQTGGGPKPPSARASGEPTPQGVYI